MMITGPWGCSAIRHHRGPGGGAIPGDRFGVPTMPVLRAVSSDDSSTGPTLGAGDSAVDWPWPVETEIGHVASTRRKGRGPWHNGHTNSSSPGYPPRWTRCATGSGRLGHRFIDQNWKSG